MTLELLHAFNDQKEAVDARFVADGVEVLRITDDGTVTFRGRSVVDADREISIAMKQWCKSDDNVDFRTFTTAQLDGLTHSALLALFKAWATRLNVLDVGPETN